jgi:hypothetical protein
VSPEKQRIAIAEACGWTLCRADNKTWRTPEQKAKNLELLGHENGPWSFESSGPPNYLNDLNAIHEAEKTLPQDLRARWMIELCKLTEDSFWSTTRATAAQRAEAFLRTLNLWTDDQ